MKVTLDTEPWARDTGRSTLPDRSSRAGLSRPEPAPPIADTGEASVRFPGLRRLYPQVRATEVEVLFDRT